MAHELTIGTDAEGREYAEAMYANAAAWHRLGEVFKPGETEAPDSETALRLARLDWRVEGRPLFLADGTPVPGWFANTRSDNGTVLGVVSDSYETLQNREAFAFLDSMAAQGRLRYESAFSLNGGRRVCLLARMPGVDHVAAGDAQLRYVMALTSHDGTAALSLLPTAVRVVCANTVRLALQTGGAFRVSIRHTSDMRARMESARRYLAAFDKGFRDHAESCRILAAARYTKEQAKAFIDALFPEAPAGATERTRKHHARVREIVRAAWRHPANRVGGMEGTWWGLVNVVSHAIDHDLPQRGSDPQNRLERRVASVLLDGPGAELKAKAVRLAISMAV